MTATLRLSEDDFLTRVMAYAQLRGWMVAHHRPCRTAKGWRTPVQGDPGCPDLVLARGGVVLLVELKSDKGRLGPGQAEWLDAADGHGRLWKPRDWPKILEELR